MRRAFLVVLALCLLPGAAAQTCSSPPQVSLENAPDLRPLFVGESVEDSFVVFVGCDDLPFTTPAATITVRLSIDDLPDGFGATLDPESVEIEGQDCLGGQTLEIPVVLHLSYDTLVQVAPHQFHVIAQADCEGLMTAARRGYEVWVRPEGTFEVSPLEQTVRRGQNQDVAFEFTFRSTYNTPIRVDTKPAHAGGDRLASVIPPSQTTLDFGHEAPFEHAVRLLARTPHENGHVNYTSTYDVRFEAEPAQGLRPNVLEGTSIPHRNATVTAQVVGNFAPGPAPALLIGLVAAGVALVGRRRRDA